MRERLSEVFTRSPEEALERVLADADERAPYRVGALLWTSTLGSDGIRYGSYKYVTRKKLEGRTYQLEFVDYNVGILFTDMLYNAQTHKNEPLL